MQGQEKLTFIVILLLFSITLCCTLISANEKISFINDYFDEQLLLTDVSIPECHNKEHKSKLLTNIYIFDYLFPIKFLKYFFSTISNSVRTIVTMPFVLRRLTLAECCSWFRENLFEFFKFFRFFF